MSMIDRNKKQDLVFLKEYSGPCPYCGYTLKNPTGRLCPECGSKLRVAVCAPFRFSPWHALLASIAISVGVLLDRVVLTMMGVAGSGFTEAVWTLVWFTLLPFVVLSICFYFVWKQKARINSTCRWKRVLWCVASVGILVLVVFVQLYGLLRLLGYNLSFFR